MKFAISVKLLPLQVLKLFINTYSVINTLHMRKRCMCEMAKSKVGPKKKLTQDTLDTCSMTR